MLINPDKLGISFFKILGIELLLLIIAGAALWYLNNR
jgi:hypothetical protein